MFFIAYKLILGFLMGPGFFVLFLIVLAGITSYAKKGDRRQNKKLKMISLLLLLNAAALYIVTIEPVKDGIVYLTEKNYKPIDVKGIADGEVIVVLGSGINDYAYTSFANTREEEGTPAPAAMARLTEAVKIFYKSKEVYKKEPYILISGGKVFENYRGEAEVYFNFLKGLGIPQEKIIIEKNSKTTYENAYYSKKLIDEKKLTKIILVTSATHMKRGVVSFKKAGLDVTPAPCDYQIRNNGYDIFSFVPDARNMAMVKAGVWEIIGGIYYRFKK